MRLMAETILTDKTTIEQKEQALAAARQCIDLLKRRFGATRVILFGSLAGQGVWHSDSDIDLAVEGIPPADFFRAYNACDALLPPGLQLDLVPLEDTYPEMRARILGEVEMPDDPLLVLKGLVEDELTALERVERQMESLLADVDEAPTWVELYAIAGMSHEFYNGIERIFERIVVTLGEGLPKGSAWHVDLLDQVAIPTETRPVIIGSPLQDRLTEYLKFRHFFRHAYGHTLEWDRLRWQAEEMSETLRLLIEQLMAFFEGAGRS